MGSFPHATSITVVKANKTTAIFQAITVTPYTGFPISDPSAKAMLTTFRTACNRPTKLTKFRNPSYTQWIYGMSVNERLSSPRCILRLASVACPFRSMSRTVSRLSVSATTISPSTVVTVRSDLLN